MADSALPNSFDARADGRTRGVTADGGSAIVSLHLWSLNLSGKPVRFGLIGTGMMGYEHILNLKLLPEAQIVAMTDPASQSIVLAQAVLGDALKQTVTVYPDADALLADRTIDAVVIASPNFTHAAVLRRALKSGKHILCEKPVCTTLDDLREIRALAAAHEGVFWVGMEYRYMPPAARFVEEVAQGKVGRLRMLAIREHRFPFLKKVGDWNRFSRNTGGTMVEKCCHFFDLMRLIVKATPVRIYCSGAMDVNHLDERYDGQAPDIIDNSYTVVDFDDGTRAMLDLCMFAEGSKNQEEIAAVGDAGKLEVFIPDGDIVFSPRKPKGPERLHVPVDEAVLRAGHHHGATFYQHQAFLRAVRGDGPVEVGIEDGYWAVLMGLAAEISVRERRAVALADLLD
jgi:myo-inositol 2-dehydrogenase / D-chiro-inositol 1-dehydrogenase